MMRSSVFTFAAVVFSVSVTLGSEADYAWRPVEKGVSVTGLSVTGKVVPQDGALSVESARVQGRVIAILKREGETIATGMPLYSISSAECFSLQEEKRVAAAKELKELMSGVERREKQLGLKLQGDDCFAVASRSGVLTKRNLESGASFNAGDSLATILDIKRLTIELDVPEREQAKVKTGLKVTFQFASHPGETFTSKIENVVPTIDPAARTSKARLAPMKFPSSTSLDALVFGEIDTNQSGSHLKVPTSALVFSHNQQYVVAKSSGKPAAVSVHVLGEAGADSSIEPLKSGALKEGDLVATRGAIFLLKQIFSEIVP